MTTSFSNINVLADMQIFVCVGRGLAMGTTGRLKITLLFLTVCRFRFTSDGTQLKISIPATGT
jgi:hypothetical protein